MRELSIIHSGACGPLWGTHKDYEKRIEQNTPVISHKFTIIPYNVYGDICFNLNVNGHIIGISTQSYANVTDDMIIWLETICREYKETILFMDDEGTEHMLRFYTGNETNSTGRLSILSTDEAYYDVKLKKYHSNPKTYKIYKKTGKTPIVCDILISQKEFVKKFYNAILKGISKIKDETNFAIPPIKKSEIIENFIK